jgi:hypothetical protein
MLNYFTISTVAELLCFLTGILCLIKDKSYVWRCMVIYLFLTCAAELTGIYISGPKRSVNNNWVYNIFLVFEAGFTNLMFAYLLGKYINSKPIIIIGLAIVATLYVFELHDNYVHHILIYNINTYKVLSILFVIYSLYYYYLLLKDKNYVRLRYSPEFWWVAGTLLFYFTNTACNIFYKPLSTVLVWNGIHLTRYIISALNILLYGCWSYSFICRKWQTTTLKV